MNTATSTPATLADLKAGDYVAYKIDYGRQWYTTKIIKRTATGMIVCKDRTFNADGTARGVKSGNYGCPSICVPLTDDISDDLRRYKLADKLDRFNYKTLTLDQLQRVNAIMSESTNVVKP